MIEHTHTLNLARAFWALLASGRCNAGTSACTFLATDSHRPLGWSTEVSVPESVMPGTTSL